MLATGRCLSCLLILITLVGCSTERTDTQAQQAVQEHADIEKRLSEAKAYHDRWNREHGCIDSETASGWMIQRCTDKMDGSKSVSLTKSHMVIRCKNGKTDIYINLDTRIQPEYGVYNAAHVRVKFDNGKPAQQVWSESPSSDALFSRNPRALAKQLAQAKTFYFEYTPFEEANRVLELDITGLDDVLPELATACEWNKREKAELAAAQAEKKQQQQWKQDADAAKQHSDSIEKAVHDDLCRKGQLPADKCK